MIVVADSAKQNKRIQYYGAYLICQSVVKVNRAMARNSDWERQSTREKRRQAANQVTDGDSKYGEGQRKR
jgi:hypothetical protein